jgi:hypothetical protein
MVCLFKTTWWVSKRTGRNKQNYRLGQETREKKRTKIDDEEYRKQHGDGRIPGMRYMLDKKQRILRHCCEPMSNDVLHSMAFWRTRHSHSLGSKYLEKVFLYAPPGGGIHIAARLRFLIAHKWDRAIRRPSLDTLGGTVYCNSIRADRRQWKSTQREIGNWAR